MTVLGPLPPPAGGVASFDAQLINHLRERGLSVTGLRPFPQTVIGVVVQAMRLSRRSVVLDSSGMFAEYLEPNATRTWLAAHRVRRLRWVKVVHDGTLPDRWAAFSDERRGLALRSLRAADVLVGVGDALADWLGTTTGRPVEHITSILPPDVGETETPPAEFSAVRARAPQLVAAVGAFTEAYGFDDVARAVERLRSEPGMEQVHLVLLTTGFAIDEAYAAQVIAERPWLTVLTDVPRPAAISIMGQSDVVVRAARTESYGLARIEALLAGTPVVATPTGETRGMLLFSSVDELTRSLREVLAGAVEPEVDHWRAVFEREAEENLTRLVELVGART